MLAKTGFKQKFDTIVLVGSLICEPGFQYLQENLKDLTEFLKPNAKVYTVADELRVSYARRYVLPVEFWLFLKNFYEANCGYRRR